MQRFMGFMQRMDENGNGVLEPGEFNERSRQFMEPMLREAGIDPNRPIELRRLEEIRRRQYEQEAGRAAGAGEAVAPLVPGFGNQFEDTPTLGFSDAELATADAWQESYGPRELERARETLGRYDRNKNGVLERDEWALNRTWSPPPSDSDANKDGKLTLKELSERYKQREERENQERGERGERGGWGGGGFGGGGWGGFGGGAPGGGGPGGGWGGPGGGGEDDGGGGERRRGGWGRGGEEGGDQGNRAERFYTQLDQNKNGTLEPSEVPERMKQFIEPRLKEAGMDPSKPISIKKLVASRDGGERREGGSTAAAATAKKATKPTSDRYKTPVEALPRGIDSWFKDKDVNKNGRIEMHEFTKTWNADVVAEFYEFDVNHDGVISAQECLDGPGELVAVRAAEGGGRSTASSSRDSRAAKPPAAKTASGGSTRVAAADEGDSDDSATTSDEAGDEDGEDEKGEEAPAKSKTPAAAGGAESPSDKAVRMLFKAYDKNENGTLEKDEQKGSLTPYKEIDRSKDGAISEDEYRTWYEQKYGQK